MGKYSQMLTLIKERFERYQTYYQLLAIKPDDLTDEMVKEVYDRKCQEIRNLLKDCEQGNEEVEEIREIMQVAIDDAYSALKDENSRKHYQELLNYIEEKKGEER